MKQTFLLALFILIFQSGYSQVKRVPAHPKAFVSIGYGITKSDNLSEYYDILVNNYRSLGVPVSTQREFGPTLMANAGVIFNLIENIGAGISFGYLYSPAYSNYKDYAGTLKINGSVRSFEILLNVYYTLLKVGEFPIVLSPQLGVSHSSVLITQEVRFNNFSENNYNWKMTKDGWGPCAQLTIGTSINLGEFIVALEGGYRYTQIHVTEQTEESTTGTEEVNKAMGIGLNGFISDLSFGIKF